MCMCVCACMCRFDVYSIAGSGRQDEDGIKEAVKRGQCFKSELGIVLSVCDFFLLL